MNERRIYKTTLQKDRRIPFRSDKKICHTNYSDCRTCRINTHDFDTKSFEFHLHNAEQRIFYRDNDRQTEVDLHKPYVDTYRFTKDGHTYKRIPEVMDCRFES